MQQYVYKDKNGKLKYTGNIISFIFQEESELSNVPTSDDAQLAIVIGDGSGAIVKIRLPGEDWTLA